jgi:GT2 family glycosyltransferase
LIRFETADGRILIEPMNGPVLGTGEWIGVVPKETVAVSISPVDRLGPFEFALESVEALPPWHLAHRTAVFETSRITAAIAERVLGRPDEERRGLKLAVKVTPFVDYQGWHSRLARQTELTGIDRPRADWQATPAFSFLIGLAGSQIEDVHATIQSLKDQIYPRLSLGALLPFAHGATVEAYRHETQNDRRFFEVDREQFLRVLPGLGSDDCVCVISPGDTLPDNALAIVAEALAQEPALALVYGDEDAIARDGTRHSPVFKPNWSPVRQRLAPYVGRLTCVRRGDLLRSGCETVGAFLANEERALDRVLDTLAPRNVGHIRRVLYHRRRERHTMAPDTSDRSAVKSPGDVGNDADLPEVTIVIPTRDLAHLLSECVRGLKETTDYPRYRVVVMDNGSTQPEAVALLNELRRTPRFTVVDRPGPFNFSSLCNEGAHLTKSPFLVFLNNDIEMIERDWLKAMIRWAMQPDIGVVGAKLFFPDRTIQHAGVVVGLGGIGGHIYRKQASDAPGYLGALKIPHEVSVVTAACIAIERTKFDAVGGFDAENLPVELNDLDLCLRVAERGWSNLWTPQAVLIHHESASRGMALNLNPSETYRKERAYFSRRWRHIIRDDPYFHPGLSLFTFQPTLA